MLSVRALVHLVPVQPKYEFMKVNDALMVCLPGVRPSMITQYPAVPVGNSSRPTGRGALYGALHVEHKKFTWPSLPCATTPAENSVMIDSCRFETGLQSTDIVTFVQLEALTTVWTSSA